MAVLITADLPTTAEDDHEISTALGLYTGAFPEMLLRLAGPYEDSWRIVALWETLEAFEAFRDGPLAEALQARGRPVPTFSVWEPETVFGASR